MLVFWTFSNTIQVLLVDLVIEMTNTSFERGVHLLYKHIVVACILWY